MLDLRSVRIAPRRLWWLGFAGLCVTVLLHLAVYLVEHHSTSFLALAAGMTVFALGGAGVGLIVGFDWQPERLVAVRDRAARWRSVYLAGGLALGFGFGLGLRPEWIYAHAAVMLGVAFALGYDLLYADERPVSRRWFAAAGVVVVVVTVVRILGLAVYPSMQVTDEGWLLAWVVGYLKTGHFSDYLMYYGRHDVQRYYLPMAWWMKLVGIGWWQGRLFNLIMTLPLTVMSGLAARNLFGRAAGGLTMGFMFVSAVVMVGARLRHDVGLGLAIAACLWVYSEALKRQSRPLHLLAGMMIGLGLFAHYHATGFGLALMIGLYLPRIIERVRQGSHAETRPEIDFILFGLGGLMGAAVVVVFQIIPDWQGFLATRSLRDPTNPAQYFTSTLGHVGSIAAHSQLELILIGAGLVAAIWRRRIHDLAIALSVILAHLALGIMEVSVWDYYPMPLTPLYALLVATLFTDGLKRVSAAAKTAPLKQTTAAVFLCFALINLGWTLSPPLRYLSSGGPVQPQPPPAAQYVLDHYDPATTLITAEHYYYLFLWPYRFASVLTPNMMPRDEWAHFGSNEAVWDSIAPDVVIIDRNLSTCCVPPIMTTDYLESRGYHLVKQFPGQNYPVFVYQKGKSP